MSDLPRAGEPECLCKNDPSMKAVCLQRIVNYYRKLANEQDIRATVGGSPSITHEV